MPNVSARLARLAICATAVVGLSLSGDAAYAQWYRTYDEALQAASTNLTLAESKLKDAKKEAEAAGRRPGRSVLRYGSLREPFLPDYWLGQVYTKLADATTDAAAKSRYGQQALDAFKAAEVSGQVRRTDPEYAVLQTATARATAAVEAGPANGTPPPGGGGGTTTTTIPHLLASAREDIRRSVETGDRALAAHSWDAATTAFQDATKKLEATPALRAEFSTVANGLSQAALGRQFDGALEQLNAGRYAAAIDAFEQVGRADTRSLPADLRTLLSDAPRRLAEARIGQALGVGDAAYREKRWAAARDAYEGVQRLSPQGDIATAAVRDAYAQLPQRLQESRLNVALAEKRFADALAIDPKNRAALDGAYGLGLAAYNEGRWADASQAFDVILKAAGAYRDSGERKTAAEMQVEFAAGVAAQTTNSQEARAHFERVQALKNSITGPLLGSPVVVEAAENASSRMRRINADDALKNARLDYENGRWEPARNNVNLVLSIFPGDAAASELLGRLNNNTLEQDILTLSATATKALSSGDLSAAKDAATRLTALVPANSVAADVLSQVASRQAQQTIRNRWLAVLAGTLAIGPLLLISPRRRGWLLAAVGRPAGALRLYEQVLTQDPADGAVLQRAATLASTHGIDVSLDKHFAQYMRAKPGDLSIAQAAADYYWTRGLHPRAADLYAQAATASAAHLTPEAYTRLGEFYSSGIPRATLTVFEHAVRTGQPADGLVQLVAAEYGRSGRTDAEALAVFERARNAVPTEQSVRRNLAEALLANARPNEAVVEAEAALTQRPDDEGALRVLVAAYESAFASTPSKAIERLEPLQLPTAVLFCAGERIADAHRDVRSLLDTIYQQRAKVDTTPALADLMLAVRLFDSDLDGASAALEAAYGERGTSKLIGRALVQAYIKLAGLSQTLGRPVDAGVQARVGELYTELGASQEAIGAWQQTVSIPEWSRRSMSAIGSILDTLDLQGAVEAYFGTAGWIVRKEAAQSGAEVNLLVTPGLGVNKELAARFENTQVFCRTAVVSVDDIVSLKRQVLEQVAAHTTGIAFLITSFAVRHDVYALIYAFMTESPAVTFIPLDAHAIRDAIVEARTRVHLERTLHQWLGHTDIYETHNPVSNAATFFGRGQFINRLVLKISRGENFGIFGLRKIGKTSLVYRLRDLSRDHLVAYVDLQGVSSRKIDEVYVRLLESLTRDTRIKYPDVPLPPQRTLAGSGAADIAASFHEDILAIRRAFETSGRSLPHVLLLLDEIELMVPVGSSSGFEGHQDFFRHIRGLYQQERFIVSAVVGATPAVCRAATWSGRDNPVFQFYDEVFLSPLDTAECDQMVQGLGELMGVRFHADSLALIYAQTAGHPYVTRQLCSRLVKFFPERPLEVNADMVAAAVDQYLAQSGDYFAGILEGYLDDVSRRIVETIAADDGEFTSRAHILSRVEPLGVGRHVGDQALGDLELTGLIQRDEERYGLRAPLFRRWLRRSWLDLE